MAISKRNTKEIAALKKTIMFSTIERRAIIENMVEDERVLTGKTASAVIEEKLLDSLLPKDEKARYWVEYLYSGPCKMKRVIQGIFETASGGINWKSKYNNLYPLIQFCLSQEALGGSVINGDEQVLFHFRSQLDSICMYFEDIIADTVANIKATENEKRNLKKELEFARYLYQVANDEPQHLQLVNIYKIVMDNWNFLNDYQITYRLLADTISLTNNFLETEETRKELTEIIKGMAEKWEN